MSRDSRPVVRWLAPNRMKCMRLAPVFSVPAHSPLTVLPSRLAVVRRLAAQPSVVDLSCLPLELPRINS